jgi:hypothetical protein
MASQRLQSSHPSGALWLLWHCHCHCYYCSLSHIPSSSHFHFIVIAIFIFIIVIIILIGTILHIYVVASSTAVSMATFTFVPSMCKSVPELEPVCVVWALCLVRASHSAFSQISEALRPNPNPN